MKEEFFALDIGTRKVMGIIARRDDDRLSIIDVETIEHASRPMLDGQIHGIDEVARTVSLIKERLEARQHKRFEKVGVAVAGRNLFTCSSKINREFPATLEITHALIRDLELEAVDKINASSGRDLAQYYCVGYSPVYYELDGNRITSPLGHRARTVAIEIIATFLPRLVLDSIFAVLKKARLQASNITLEPISAINAIIPAEMRNLNIVLVDIGAGTSDLALAKDGMVFAYGMVPEAGDEITEFISANLLVDFSTAETIKRSLETEGQIEYRDIWNRLRKTDTRTLKLLIEPAVKKLADAIASSALELNAGPAQAVVLVGGGSLTSNLIEKVAAGCSLPAYKVGVRLPSMIKDLADKTGKLTGPEAVTPIGIALMTEQSQGLRFIEVAVNGTKVMMLDFQQKKDIMGALTLSGLLNEKKLYPRPGMALTVKVNGELKIVKGTLGVPAQVLHNAKPAASLSDKIEHGDTIELIEAKDGDDARARIADLVAVVPRKVRFNGQPLEVHEPILLNGEAIRENVPVPDRAQIEVLPLKARHVLESQSIDLEGLVQRSILLHVNGVPRVMTQRNFTLLINGASAELDAQVSQGDAIDFSNVNPTSYRIRDIIEMPAGFETMRINVDDRDIEVVVDTVQVFMNGHQVSPDEFVIDGADITVYRIQDRKVLLSEIFKYVQIDPQKVLGKRIKILVDEMPAGFTTPLADGSRVKLIFEDRSSKV